MEHWSLDSTMRATRVAISCACAEEHIRRVLFMRCVRREGECGRLIRPGCVREVVEANAMPASDSVDGAMMLG